MRGTSVDTGAGGCGVDSYSAGAVGRVPPPNSVVRDSGAPIERLSSVSAAVRPPAPTANASTNLLAATLVIVLGLVMGYHAAGGPLGVCAAVALTIAFAVSLSWGAWTASCRAPPNAVMSVGFVILFLSNVFVEPGTMPAALRWFADVNPISHLVTAARRLMDGTATLAPVLWVVAASAVLTAVLAPLTAWLYRRR
jgi:ABC-2 type transport system permease protein